MIKLSDYVMRFLAARGVREVFMLPGGGAMHLDDSLGRSPDLHYTCCLHEQAIGIAVEAWGQHTNTPGAAVVTSGPGAVNTLTAVAAAWIDSTPVFMISGQAKRSDLKLGTGCRQVGSQEVDIVGMVSGITKYAAMVLHPEEIRRHLEKAWHEAVTGRMGPVWLDIPLDVQAAMVDPDALVGYTPPEAPPRAIPPGDLDAIGAALAEARRPLLLVGNGVKLAGAGERLVAWAERLGVPMVLTWKVVDLLDYDHPLNFGSPGIMGQRYANFIVQNCDLLLSVGSRLDPSVTAFNMAEFARNARKKIMVDIDACELGRVREFDIRIEADAGAFIDRLADAGGGGGAPTSRGEWLAYCRRVKARYPVTTDADRADPDGPVNLYAFTDELFRRLTPADVIAPESSGAAGEVLYQAMRVKKGQKIRNAAGLGSMGFGLPYAIGACLANGRRRTVLVNGDGAFQLNVQELETVRRLRLPLKMFIWDNGGYGTMINTQRNLFDGFLVGAEPGSGLTLPDVLRQARVYDIRTEEAASNADAPAAIARTLAGEDAALCRVRVDPGHRTRPRVQAVKTPDGSMTSMPLENMWPFLRPEELAENMFT